MITGFWLSASRGATGRLGSVSAAGIDARTRVGALAAHLSADVQVEVVVDGAEPTIRAATSADRLAAARVLRAGAIPEVVSPDAGQIGAGLVLHAPLNPGAPWSVARATDAAQLLGMIGVMALAPGQVLLVDPCDDTSGLFPWAPNGDYVRSVMLPPMVMTPGAWTRAWHQDCDVRATHGYWDGAYVMAVRCPPLGDRWGVVFVLDNEVDETALFWALHPSESQLDDLASAQLVADDLVRAALPRWRGADDVARVFAEIALPS